MTACRFRRRPGPARRAAAGIAALAGVAAPLLTSAASAYADEPVVSVEPAEGEADWGNIRLVTNRHCPDEATNVIVRISGASFPEDSNAVGNSELDGFAASSDGEGLVIPLFGSWEAVAEANGADNDLDGDAQLRLVCIDGDASEIVEEITGEVRFDRQSEGPSSYQQADGPELSSGLPLTPSDVPGDPGGPYVYRIDLPPGTPGGPPTDGAPNGGDGEAVAPEELAPGSDDQADEGAPQAAEATDGDEDGSGGERSDDSAESGGDDDTAPSALERFASPSATPLLIGAGIAAAGATVAWWVYTHERKRGRSQG